MARERISLTYAGDHYLDRTLGLEDGSVPIDGVDLTYLAMPVHEIFARMARLEFEASEMSMSTLMLMHSQGDDSLVAIPVFPSRAFRHSQIYVNDRAGIKSAGDLRGRRVGVQDYQITAALWQRAMLEHDYGVRPADVKWFVGGLRAPLPGTRYPHDPPPGVEIERIADDLTLQELLDRGELDAVLAPRSPDPFRFKSGSVRRLFPDYRAVEQDYYRRTGFFPIMHTVVIRRDVYEANRWMPRAMLDAFSTAKRQGLERLAELDTLSVMHPWIGAEVDAIRDFFGGDPFIYGFEANRAILEAMAGYSWEQRLSTRPVDPAELFAPEVMDWSERDVLLQGELGN